MKAGARSLGVAFEAVAVTVEPGGDLEARARPRPVRGVT